VKSKLLLAGLSSQWLLSSRARRRAVPPCPQSVSGLGGTGGRIAPSFPVELMQLLNAGLPMSTGLDAVTGPSYSVVGHEQVWTVLRKPRLLVKGDLADHWPVPGPHDSGNG